MIGRKKATAKTTHSIPDAIRELDITKGSFIVEGGVLKVVAFSADGKRIEKSIKLGKASVDISIG